MSCFRCTVAAVSATERELKSEDTVKKIITDIREYNEEMPVEIDLHEKNARHILRAFNEAGWKGVEIDLLDILTFIKKKMPYLWELADKEVK